MQVERRHALQGHLGDHSQGTEADPGYVAQLGLVVGSWAFSDVAPELRTAIAPIPSEVENTRALGRLVYTEYVLLFQLAGMILLVAMIGAIVLTLRHKEGVKRQNVLNQIYRERHEAVELKDVKPGQGI